MAIFNSFVGKQGFPGVAGKTGVLLAVMSKC